MIKNKGFSYSVFSTLVNACVNSITDYGSEIFGFSKHLASDNIYLRAARSFIGLPKTAPKDGIISEINWLLPQYRSQLKMIRYFHKLMNLDSNRLTKRIFLWDKHLNDSGIISTWTSEVKSILTDNNQLQIMNTLGLVDINIFLTVNLLLN